MQVYHHPVGPSANPSIDRIDGWIDGRMDWGMYEEQTYIITYS